MHKSSTIVPAVDNEARATITALGRRSRYIAVLFFIFKSTKDVSQFTVHKDT